MPAIYSCDRIHFTSRSELDIMRPDNQVPAKVIINETMMSHRWLIVQARSRTTEVLYSRAVSDGSQLSFSEIKRTIVLRRKGETAGEPHEVKLIFGDIVDFWKCLSYIVTSRGGGDGTLTQDIPANTQFYGHFTPPQPNQHHTIGRRGTGTVRECAVNRNKLLNRDQFAQGADETDGNRTEKQAHGAMTTKEPAQIRNRVIIDDKTYMEAQVGNVHVKRTLQRARKALPGDGCYDMAQICPWVSEQLLEVWHFALSCKTAGDGSPTMPHRWVHAAPLSKRRESHVIKKPNSLDLRTLDEAYDCRPEKEWLPPLDPRSRSYNVIACTVKQAERQHSHLGEDSHVPMPTRKDTEAPHVSGCRDG
ncbi:hypothetical protein C8Q76DRAFT_690233 [Earliella scabrosa]|nr:hypothetical protein C8Q76DRAFT_690233 [Earliella scabrosa]